MNVGAAPGQTQGIISASLEWEERHDEKSQSEQPMSRALPEA